MDAVIALPHRYALAHTATIKRSILQKSIVSCITMPRHSQSTHPVAVVRKYTGKTQEAFAKLVGVAAVTIRKIESAGRELSPDIADKICRATGVDPASLLDINAPYPLQVQTKKRYTAEDFESWRSSDNNDFTADSQEIIEYAEVLKEEIEILLFASVTKRYRSFRPVLSALCQSLAQISKTFGLADAVSAVRKGTVGPSTPEHEMRKENTYVYRLFGTTKFSGKRQLDKGNSGITFFNMKHSRALKASLARRHRLLLLKEIRRLSRLPRKAKAK